MGLFFVYILKSSVCLAIFYLFYRLLLARETFHRFNRFSLLGILLLSCLLPLVEVSVKQETEVHQTMLTLEQLLMMADAVNATEDGARAEKTSDRAAAIHALRLLTHDSRARRMAEAALADDAAEVRAAAAAALGGNRVAA